MPKIVKINNITKLCFTPKESDRFPNVYLGKNCRVITNNILKKDPKLNQFINEETMGALDNYAEHENMSIYITPLENDMFNDLAVSVYKKGHEDVKFPVNVAETREEVPQFFRDLYNKIHNATHSSKSIEPAIKTKHNAWTDFKMYAQNVSDRYNQARLSILDKFE